MLEQFVGVERLRHVQVGAVVLLTAKGQAYDRQQGEDAGADLYMTKPFDPDELLQHARSVLGLEAA